MKVLITNGSEPLVAFTENGGQVSLDPKVQTRDEMLEVLVKAIATLIEQREQRGFSPDEPIKIDIGVIARLAVTAKK